jgi:ABC-type branched-subunit amino acid transport system ATPase component
MQPTPDLEPAPPFAQGRPAAGSSSTPSPGVSPPVSPSASPPPSPPASPAGAPGAAFGRAASGGEALLVVRDLDVSYAKAVSALRGVSLSVPEGSIVTVLGNNGAGKSTLLRAISGTLPFQNGSVDGGSIEFAGRPLRGAAPAGIVRAGLVQVPEGRQVFHDLTVEENLRAGGLGVPRRARAAARARVHELFPVLRERRGQRAGLLSGGEQQMLAIGRALMSRPRLLLLDEPSLGLAPQMVERIGEVVAEINRQGVSIVLVEQNAALALRLADTAYVLSVGQVTLQGPAAELARSEEVRDRYLGVTGTVVPAPPAAAATGAARKSEARGATGAGGDADRPGAAEQARELVVEGVTVRFGGIAALSDVSFTVRPGTTHALIGPNGAGKSTCLNVLTGIYAAREGRVRYGDRELTRLRPHEIARLGVSRTFQNILLSPRASVADNLLLGRHRLTRAGFLAVGLGLPGARRERAAQDARVREIAELLELDAHLGTPVAALSYGERKRVELARALCAEPTLLLLDEPVAGMTGGESRRMAGIIARVRTELGISILVVEHDMAFVMGIADRVTVLDFGRRIADGAPQEIRDDPEVLRAYLGADAAGPPPGAGGGSG